MLEIKGSNVQSTPEFVKKKFGEEKYNQWLASLSEEAKELFSYRVHTTEWYSVKTFLAEPTIKIADLFFNGDVDVASWQIGRFSGERMGHGIYKMVLKIGSPNFLITSGVKMFSQMVRPVDISIPDKSRTHAHLVISGLHDSTGTLELRHCAWLERVLELVGVQDINFHWIQKTKGNQQGLLEYNVSWKMN